MHALRASPVFGLVVVATLALFALIAVMLFGGLLGLEAIAAMGHFGSLSHRVHDLTYAFLFGVAAAGMLSQLRTPTRNVAGQVMTLVPWGSFVAAYALGNIVVFLLRPPFVPIFGVLALLATMLHPTWSDLFSSFSVSRANRLMLALVAIAAVPLLAFALANSGLQRTVLDDHAAQAHYGYMTAFSIAVIGTGLLASLRPNGWWLPAWVTGLLPALLGLASLVFPDAQSSLEPVWALVAIAWGGVFIVAAELTSDADNSALFGPLRGPRGAPLGDMRPDRGPTASTPRWVNAFGLTVLVLVLLVVITMVVSTFAGSSGHMPPGGHGGPG